MIEFEYLIIIFSLLYPPAPTKKMISLKITVLNTTSSNVIAEKFKNCFYSCLSDSFCFFIFEL